MARQIEMQPNGKYAVWSTIVDGYVIVDATPEEIIEQYVEDARRDIEARVHGDVKRLNEG